MKNKLSYLPFFLLIVFGLVHYGCEEESDEICELIPKIEYCQAPDLATACCTENECYYEYEGKTYRFKDGDKEGEDKAMADLIADMCGIEDDGNQSVVLEMKTRLKAQTDRLLIEARASVICN